MSNKPESVALVLDTFAVVGLPSVRAMMGGHLIYLDGVLVGQINDDDVYLKATPATSTTHPELARRPPYPGAKPALVITDHLEEPDALAELLRSTHEALVGVQRKPPRRRSK